MANTLITPSMIAREGLFHLENNCVLANSVYSQYAKEFKGTPKIGTSVSIRKPVQFTVSDGSDATSTIQDVEEDSVTLTISHRKHVAWQFNSEELTLSIEEYSNRYIKPAMIVLADKVDRTLAEEYANLNNAVGTPGTTPADFDALSDAGARLDDLAVPFEERCAVLNPAAKWAILAGEKALFNSDQKAQADIVRRGILGRMADFEVKMDQNIVRHQCGADVDATILIDDATAAEGDTTIHMDGFTVSTANALRVGDVFTIANVFAVNPVNKETLDWLQQFTVTAAATSDGSGDADVSFFPSLQAAGPNQNISALPADNAAVTVMGADDTYYPQNLCFHRNAIALATVPLAMPDGVSFKARASHGGIGIRVIKDYNILTDVDIIRMDILFGTKVIYPELGVRLWG